MEATTEQKFNLWYKDVLFFLEHHTNKGSGAIAALMVVMPLYERWVSANCAPDTYVNRMALVRSDLSFPDTPKAENFWNVFRDGLCHTGSFFEASGRSKNHNPPITLPKVGLNKDYPAKPTFVFDPSTNLEVIIVNPWGLVEHILKKYEGNASLLEGPDAPLLPLSYTVIPTKA